MSAAHYLVHPGLVTAVACVVVGCGGKAEPPPEQAGVREAIQRLDRAQAAGDGGAACNGLVAVEEQGRIEVPGAEEREAAGRDVGEPGHGTGDDAAAPGAQGGEAAAGACERAFERATASRRALRDVALEVGDVRITGDRATAAVRTRVTRPDGSKLAQDGTRRLVRRDGRWRVLVTEE